MSIRLRGMGCRDRKMAEPAGVAENKVDEVLGDRREEHNDRSMPLQLPHSEFTAELNLLFMFLSLFSLSTNESLYSLTY